MADVKISDLLADHPSAGLALTDGIEVCDDPGGTPESQGATLQQVVDLVHANTTPEDIGAVAGPGSPTSGNLPQWNGGTDSLIDSGIPVTAIATAQGAAEDAQDDADAALAAAALAEAKIKSIEFLSTYPGSVVAASTNGKRTFCSVAGGADFGLGIQDDCVVGHEQWFMRTYTGTTDPGGSVIVVDAGTATHIIGGTDRIDTAFRWMCLRCYAYDSGTNTRYWTLEEESVPVRPTVRAAHTSSTLTLTPEYGGAITPLNGASNAIAVTIPHTLFLAASGVAGGPLARAFRAWHRVSSVAGGALSFTGSGGIVITYHGKNPSTKPFAAGDLIEVVVTSATSADIITHPAGESGAVLYQYTSSTTLAEPVGALYVDIEVVGAGGGGGGGASATGSGARVGGSGGGGGARSARVRHAVADLTWPLTVTVGAGGTSGAGHAGGGGNGSDGGDGGLSRVLDASSRILATAGGGGGGWRGQSSGAAAGGPGGGGTGTSAVGGFPNSTNGGPGPQTSTASGGGGAQGSGVAAGGYAEWGGGSGGGRTAAGVAYAGGSSLYGGAGGGHGGCVASGPSVTQPAAGGAGATLTAGGGGAAGTSGSSPTAGTAGTAGGAPGRGTAGGGGGSNSTTNGAGAAGGAGGAWGHGGGGGGCGEGSGAGGAGGVGGSGGVRIWVIY